MGKYYAESDEDMPCKPLVNCLPVIFLLLIFGWAYYAYVVAFCVYLIEPVEKKAIYLTLFHVLFIMACITYFAAMCIENERVPGYYRLPIVEYELLKTANTEDAKNRLLEDFCKVRNISVYTVTNTGGVRFCKKCKHIKPDRAHHCSSCKTCILKMDHHCPWLNNCVGFSNYKFFIIFLFYTVLCSVYVFGTGLEYFIKFWQTDMEDGHYHHLVALVIAAFCVAILIGSLLAYHISLILKNQTTLEALREPQFKYPSVSFDLGNRDNLIEVFGDQLCCWCLPINTSNGNGLEFPLQAELD